MKHNNCCRGGQQWPKILEVGSKAMSLTDAVRPTGDRPPHMMK